MMLLVCAALMTTWPDDLKAKEAELEKERAVQVRLQELLQRARCDTRLAGQCLEISSGKRESWIEESSPKRICTAFRKTWVLLQPTEPTAGQVWIIQEINGIFDSEQRKSTDRWQAWRGSYLLSIDRVDEEMLHVWYESNRRFAGTGNRPKTGAAEVDWAIDVAYVRKWMDLQIPLVDGQVPSEKVQLTIHRVLQAEPGKNGSSYRDVTFPTTSPYSTLPKSECADFGYLGLSRGAKVLDAPPSNWFTPPPGLKMPRKSLP